MKKILICLVAIMLIIGNLTACSSINNSKGKTKDKLNIVTTIYPAYDWIMNVLGDNPTKAEVSLLVDNGVDFHSYQPSAEDILKISDCDIFIYVGGESDGWVSDVLKEALNKDMIVINLLEVLGDLAKEEEIVEGMQEDEHDHNHEHEHGDEIEEHKDELHDDESHEEAHEDDQDEPHQEEIENDEHVWLSLKNAAMYVDCISEALQKADEKNAEIYKSNSDTYIDKLSDLDAEYASVRASAKSDTLLFGDRFPFRYMTDDYNINYYAAFAGCSAETEASFETITFLAEKIDELSLKAVITIDGSDQKIAKTIIQNTKTKDQKILTLNSMQSVTSDDYKNNITYLSIMEDNLDILKEALN